MSSTPLHIYPGLSTWKNSVGATVLRLSYEADPTKEEGSKTFVPELKKNLSPWALAEYKKIGNAGLFAQEYLVDGSATQGQLVFQMDKEATLCKSFPIPKEWTRYVALDPHPRVPDAWLWCAVDPWGDRWYYRELWPSKVCFKYQADGTKVGKAGNSPEEDAQIYIKDYVQVIRYLESADNPENVDQDGNYFDETIAKRVIDYAARSFGKGTSDDPSSLDFQQRYQAHMSGNCECNPRCEPIYPDKFEDAVKDHGAGFDCVNEGLKPFDVEGNDGKFHKKSRIHIFSDRCPELIYQMDHYRREQLTSEQAAKQDPSAKVIAVRSHLCDCLRYVEMAKPEFIPPLVRRESSWKPQVPGIAY